MVYHYRSDFFYRVNNRRLPGVNWGANVRFSHKVRNCRDGISIGKKEFDKLAGPDYIEASIYYYSVAKNTETFKGRFRIDVYKVMKWEHHNGLYRTKGGKDIIVIPVVLWERIQEGDKSADKSQPTLFD